MRLESEQVVISRLAKVLTWTGVLVGVTFAHSVQALMGLTHARVVREWDSGSSTCGIATNCLMWWRLVQPWVPVMRLCTLVAQVLAAQTGAMTLWLIRSSSRLWRPGVGTVCFVASS